MGDLSGQLFCIVFCFSIIYIVFLRPKFEKMRDELIFDNRVLAFIDGLHLAGIEFGCACFEMRSYVRSQLSKAHRIPGNQCLIEYTTAKGFRYCSQTGNGDHMLFAILCIAQYAKECGNANLVSWCESNMNLARRDGINY